MPSQTGYVAHLIRSTHAIQPLTSCTGRARHYTAGGRVGHSEQRDQFLRQDAPASPRTRREYEWLRVPVLQCTATDTCQSLTCG